MLDDPDAIVAEFDAAYGRNALKRKCLVCDSEHRELIDVLLRRGAGGPSISRFLLDKFGVEIGQATIGRHKGMHVDSPRAQENR